MFRLRVDPEIELGLLVEEDAQPLFDLIEAHLEDLGTWFDWVDRIRTAEALREIIATERQGWSNREQLAAAIRYRGELAGRAGYDPPIDVARRRLSLGYWLAPPFRGKGIGTRVAHALMRHAFLEMGMQRVDVVCAAEDARSRRVAERAGMRLTETLKGGRLVRGQPLDLVRYTLRLAEWSKKLY